MHGGGAICARRNCGKALFTMCPSAGQAGMGVDSRDFLPAAVRDTALRLFILRRFTCCDSARLPCVGRFVLAVWSAAVFSLHVSSTCPPLLSLSCSPTPLIAGPSTSSDHGLPICGARRASKEGQLRDILGTHAAKSAIDSAGAGHRKSKRSTKRTLSAEL